LNSVLALSVYIVNLDAMNSNNPLALLEDVLIEKNNIFSSSAKVPLSFNGMVTAFNLV
jgi:hypothetical protein